MRAFAYFSKRVFRSVSFSANRPRSTSMMWSACILSASDLCSTALVCVELLNVPWRGAVDNVRVRRWLRSNVTEERRLERAETGPPKESAENKPSEESKESAESKEAAEPEEAKEESLEEAPLVKGEEEEGERESLEGGDWGEGEKETEGEEDLGDDRSRGAEEEEREGVRTISCSMAPRAMRAENAAKVTSPSKSSPSPLLAT